MTFVINHPALVLAVTLAGMWVAGRLGVWLARWRGPGNPEIREAFNIVQGATLTLLALIIGFTFSMAISRYDQRKNYEEAEANAIGTEYVRADLLPPTDAAKLRPLLIHYLGQRIEFYETTNRDELPSINARKSDLQVKLWSAVMIPANEHRDPITALVVAGMNDVLNSDGYTQAAWWNRIPISAWILLAAIALGSNLLVGFGAGKLASQPALMLVLPLTIAVAFGLIADIDSPRGGVIRVHPQNLHALLTSLTGSHE
jgi:hypothetical protein